MENPRTLAQLAHLEQKTCELERQLQITRQKIDEIYEMSYAVLREFADEFHLNVPKLDELGAKR